MENETDNTHDLETAIKANKKKTDNEENNKPRKASKQRAPKPLDDPTGLHETSPCGHNRCSNCTKA